MEHIEKTPRTLFSFVLDNSPAVSDACLGAWISAFRALCDEMAQKQDFSWELVLFDALQPTVAKGFEDDAIAPVSACSFPLFSRAVSQACDRLLAHAVALAERGEILHRPCLILLTGGFSIDETEAVANRLDALERAEQIQYLPFSLSAQPLCEGLLAFDRVKHIIPIAPDGQEGFFAFIKGLIKQRDAQLAGEPLRLSRNDFEGWAVL